jgi:hypothetical protein
MEYDFDADNQPENQPYEVTSFARRHGLTIPAADAVLFAKGPSREACDAAALAFLCAVAAQAKKQSAR